MQLQFQSDAIRRGLRTFIDLLLSGGMTSIILWVCHLFGVAVTLEQFTALILTLTPVLSAIKNALEDKTGKSLLVDKTRPDPDPVTDTVAPLVTGSDTTAAAAGPLDNPDGEQVVWGEVPGGYILVAVAAEDVSEADDVVGITR